MERRGRLEVGKSELDGEVRGGCRSCCRSRGRERGDFSRHPSSLPEPVNRLSQDEAWLAEPYPVRAALTRTGVAFALMGTYGGFSVEGINEFGSGLLAELHDVDAFDWEGTRIALADAGASEQPSSERASQQGRREQ